MLRFRPLWSFSAAMLTLFLGCMALGVWQLERLQWKLALIAQANRNIHLAATTVGEALKNHRRSEYRRITLHGHFDNRKEAYVFATGARGAIVYHVIVPFILDDGRVLLVDRGVVPQSLRDARQHRSGQLNGDHEIAGIWRTPEAGGLFTPAPNIGKRIWYARDVASIARVDDVTLAAPVLIEADATPNPGGWPKGGQTAITFRNDHLQYAITWFALAAVVLGGWLAYHLSQGRIGWRKPS